MRHRKNWRLTRLKYLNSVSWQTKKAVLPLVLSSVASASTSSSSLRHSRKSSSPHSYSSTATNLTSSSSSNALIYSRTSALRYTWPSLSAESPVTSTYVRRWHVQLCFRSSTSSSTNLVSSRHSESSNHVSNTWFTSTTKKCVSTDASSASSKLLTNTRTYLKIWRTKPFIQSAGRLSSSSTTLQPSTNMFSRAKYWSR